MKVIQVGSLPNNMILDSTKLQECADNKIDVADKIDVAKITITVFDRIENIVGKCLVMSFKTNNSSLNYTILSFNHPENQDFKNIVGKGKSAPNQYFSPFISI